MTSIDRTDRLTGLHLASAAASMRRGSSVAVIDFIDFGRRFNEAFGHAVGDHVLRVVGTRLRESLAPARVYRVGGNTFLVEIETSIDHAAAEALASRIVELIAEPIEGVEASAQADVGITLRQIDDDVTAVRDRAEWAQWQARTRQVPYVVEGRNGEVWARSS